MNKQQSIEKYFYKKSAYDLFTKNPQLIDYKEVPKLDKIILTIDLLKYINTSFIKNKTYLFSIFILGFITGKKNIYKYKVKNGKTIINNNKVQVILRKKLMYKFFDLFVKNYLRKQKQDDIKFIIKNYENTSNVIINVDLKDLNKYLAKVFSSFNEPISIIFVIKSKNILETKLLLNSLNLL